MLPPVVVVVTAAAPETRPPEPAVPAARLSSAPVAVSENEPARIVSVVVTVAAVCVADSARETVAPAATRPRLALLAFDRCCVVLDAASDTARATLSTVPVPKLAVIRLELVASVTVELMPIRPPTAPVASAWAVGFAPRARLASTVTVLAVRPVVSVEAATVAATLASAVEAPTAAVPALMPVALA
ncbi:hypothetical protein CHKEEEPN_1500 [Methylorubrum podarium]|nr:hypothetical protein CHKEEEPN_1500 [Methylorubrum podarium]